MAKLLDRQLLDAVTRQAVGRSRLRQNYNFHALPDTVQRLLNALQPGTYVRPHRHLRSPDRDGFEFFLVLQGKVGVLTFDEDGAICDRHVLDADGPTYGIELPEGVYHVLVCLAPDTVVFELKEGPYDAKTDKDFLSGFPQEGTLEAVQQVKQWEAEFEAIFAWA